MVLQMFGSIAGSESLVISLDEDAKVKCVMAEAPHGTAPGLLGRNVANPMSMILAGASLLTHMDDKQTDLVSRAIYESTLETVYDDIRTSDLGGSAATTEFADEVIRRVKSKLPSGPPWGSQRAVACSQLFGGSALEAYSNDH